MSVFAIEQLQPDWLSTRAAVWRYHLISRTLAALVIHILVHPTELLLIIYILPFQNDLFNDLFSRYSKTADNLVLLFYLLFSYSWGVVLPGLTAGTLDWIRSTSPHGRAPWGRYLRTWVLSAILFTSPYAGLILFFLGRRRNPSRDIEFSEVSKWSFPQASRASGLGCLGGVLVGLIPGGLLYFATRLLTLTDPSGHSDFLKSSGLDGTGVLYFAVVCAGSSCLIGWIGGLVVGGLSTRLIETRTRPNQGALRALHRAMTGGACLLVLGLLVDALQIVVSNSPVTIAPVLLLLTLIAVALLFGGFDVLKHYTLRRILAHEDALPYRIVPFLDQAARLVFLRKIGGSYAFVHRLLLEHFAGQSPPVKTPRQSGPPIPVQSARGTSSTGPRR